jgi:transglutaminase-like putative cysteine protease
MNKTDRKYLQSTFFFDTDSPIVSDFADANVRGKSESEKAVSLFRAVRELIYDPYRIRLIPEEFKASSILMRGQGYCVHKAIALAAVARVVGIPSRLGLADVRNHLSTERLRNTMKTDIFVCHGYTELFVDGLWLKVTPTFNTSLCEKFGVRPLEFDGRSDCLFHGFDSGGNRHMEYVKYRGSFADVPFDLISSTMQAHYPGVYPACASVVEGDFAAEAKKEMGTFDKPL